MARRIIWDEDNLHHLQVDRAHRGITVDEVEEVLGDADTAVLAVRAGRDLYIGRTTAGRFLAVVALGESEVRPETAWVVTEDRWREAHA